MSDSLFRALRDDEIEAGCILIPKSTEPFLAPPRLPNVLPVELAPSAQHAVREHQLHGRFPTRGVSTTPHLARALHYAQTSRAVVRLDVDRLALLGIELYRVSEHVPASLIVVPEDDEVILVRREDGAFPASCIAGVIRVE